MTYTYSESGNTITENYKKGSEQILTIEHHDDAATEKRLVYTHPGSADTYTQKTDDFGRMTELVTPLGTYTYTYDGLGRVTAKTLKSGSVTVAKETYLYTESSDSGYTSRLKKRITYKDNSWDGYTCDGNGLIKNIVHSPGTHLRTYQYDGMNRLTREDIQGHKTATYEYDKAGNLTCRKEYDYHTMSLDGETPNKTVTYTYQNGRMTSYDGESCVYDENGNPTTYRGKTLTWTRGRLLETYPSLTSPEETWTFTYNADGIRVGKSAPGTTTTYGVDGERIVYEKTNGQIKRYFYDESGIAGFEYSGQKYVFRKNLQGDVVGICSSSGTLIGEYVYDAWGNLLEEPESGIMKDNPFRYRGYYYDSSIGLYYLNSRYYDPETGRFLNEDLVSYLDPETIGGINLYAYCLNDPVNYVDPSGTVVMVGSVAAGALFLLFIGIFGLLTYSNSIVNNPDFPLNIGIPSYSNSDLAPWNTPNGIIDFDLINQNIEDFYRSIMVITEPGEIYTNILLYREHRTNKRKSNKGKHEAGQRTKKKNKPGGEKGDERRPFRRNGRYTHKLYYSMRPLRSMDILSFILMVF